MGEYNRLNKMLSRLETSYTKLKSKPDKNDDDFIELAELQISIGEVKGALLEMADIDGLDDPYEAFDY